MESTLDFWHEQRYTISAAVLLLLGAAHLLIRWRSSRERVSSFPFITILDAGIGIEKAVCFEEKPSPSSLPHQGRPKSAAEFFPKLRLAPKRVAGWKAERKPKSEGLRPIKPLIFYFSLTGTTKTHAVKFSKTCTCSLKDQNPAVREPEILDLSYIDCDDYFVNPPRLDGAIDDVQYFYILLIPTYNIDTALDNFLGHLQETHNDFRIDTAPLACLAGYSVFGFGDRGGWSTEEEGFCSQAIEVDKWMAKLTGRKRAYPLGMGDVKSDATRSLGEWGDGVQKVVLDIASHGGLGEGVPGSGNPLESDGEDVADPEMEIESIARKPAKHKRPLQKSRVYDLEDLGGMARSQIQESSDSTPFSSPLPIDFTNTTITQTSSHPSAPKEMVPQTSPTHAALTKQGYTIIGSHSGVKICRWTKSALRGRGSCYKFSFYGIKSHLCMETTPSLSCSNKCVFCWRHGTNPVGTTWRWKVDPPELIFEGAREGHLRKIRMMKGVPGVRAERFQEAMRIRHCALSLVGEPIFYPHINAFLALLHAEQISSFLVCNAQHPDQLAALGPVTQLYVSIDASNAESLRKIDRPLHRDYWQRFLRCLDILREKRHSMRTVYRLTLVKGFNIDSEVEGYADLVARGLPCFVEIKGVTYCGTSSSAGAGLTMANVPFYNEITAFVEALDAALERRGLEYGIAAEHAHSCCVLIASKRFFAGGKWHTLIDFEKFFECLERGGHFRPEDYMGPPTPEWATWGRGGFDPADERVYRKGKGPMKDPVKVVEGVIEDVG